MGDKLEMAVMGAGSIESQMDALRKEWGVVYPFEKDGI